MYWKVMPCLIKWLWYELFLYSPLSFPSVNSPVLKPSEFHNPEPSNTPISSLSPFHLTPVSLWLSSSLRVFTKSFPTYFSVSSLCLPSSWFRPNPGLPKSKTMQQSQVASTVPVLLQITFQTASLLCNSCTSIYSMPLLPIHIHA